MLCPRCLCQRFRTRFKRRLHPTQAGGLLRVTWVCPLCGSDIPPAYIEDYSDFPPRVIGVVGFTQHGKTVFLASLFRSLRQAARHWDGFYTLALDETSLRVVLRNVDTLENGILPDSTPMNFPEPTMLRIHGGPETLRSTLVFYDVRGEVFESSDDLVRLAPFLKASQSVVFLVSLSDLRDRADGMFRLLNTYIVGLRNLRARPRSQRLVVAFSKADRLVGELEGRFPDLAAHIREEDTGEFKDVKSYGNRLRIVSNRLREYTRDSLKAFEFLNAADAHFHDVAFTLTSALGSAPDPDGTMRVGVTPKRVMDPLLWVLLNARREWWQFW